jgi:hypothetical protein
MSYGIDISFKNCKKSEIYDKINEFEELLLKNSKEYIEKNFYYCRYEPEKDKWENNKEIDRFISSLFKHHIWYCEEIQSLCIVWGSRIKEINDWFDGYVYFQNATDQDYDYEEWLFNEKFKSIVEQVKSLNSEDFKKEFLKVNQYYEESEVRDDDYYRKSLVYDKCESLINPIWDKGFAVSFIDGVFDCHKFDLRKTCIKLLIDEFDDFKKMYLGETDNVEN